ncbi:DUF4349 domain-containing protein [bacterium]|nr:DUF4349 domain-containing protein [bacterium]
MSLKNKILIGIGGIIGVMIILGIIGSGSFKGNFTRYTPEVQPSLREIEAPSGSSGAGIKETTKGEVEKAESEESTTPSSRLIIKSGDLNIVVNNVPEAARKIIKFAEEQGGWVVSSNISKEDEIPTGSVTVRVPVDKFEKTMTYIRGLAVKVEYEKSKGKDVTEEYVDLNSRLRNLEATENQFLEIMKKAQTIDEILKVQAELTKIRGKIERTKGRILYLERSAKMATISVNLALSEDLLPVPPAEKWRPKYVAKQAWNNVVRFWRNVSYGVIKFFVYGLIWLPLLIVVLGIIRLITQPRRRKENK